MVDAMWPFSKKKTPRLPSILPFKSGEAFFEYQCEFGVTDIVPKQGLVGLVKIISKEAGTGIQNATLQIVSRDGGFEVHSQTASANGEDLIVGDLVIWVPIQRDALLAAVYKNDERSSWMGLIVAKVAPELDLNSSQFKLVCRYA
ncbi:hypothetical protein [Tabrizicola sp.]|jgi:hypothetical protein|uniref:hypothetical protein n=1 Tax=Tabrizicola sp. TaxID=2005166 RepID=UPI0035ADECCE